MYKIALMQTDQIGGGRLATIYTIILYMLRTQYIISIVVKVTDIRVLNFIIQFVSNVFNPSNIHVVGFQQS
jgi:hypothetical protein